MDNRSSKSFHNYFNLLDDELLKTENVAIFWIISQHRDVTGASELADIGIWDLW